MIDPPASTGCHACGYDLRGQPADRGRCPECGTPYDRNHGLPTIPWLRAGSNRFVAFLSTISLATRHPALVAVDMRHPADFRSAYRFHVALTAWLAFWPILFWIVAYVAYARGNLAFTYGLHVRWSGHWTWIVEAICAGVLLLAIVAWVGMALGVPGYFCHPRRLPRDVQDRAIALSTYGAAPLAWMPLAFALGAAIEYRALGAKSIAVVVGVLIAQLAFPGIVLALWARSLGTIVRRATASGIARPIATILVSLMAWLVLFILFPVAIGAALVLLQFIFYGVVPA